MTPKDILNATPNIDRDLPVLRQGQIYMPLIGKTLELHVNGPTEDKVVTQEMADDLNALLVASPDLINQIEVLLSEHCTQTCDEVCYDMIDVEHVPGVDELVTCRRAYGMNDDGTLPPGLASDWVGYIGLDIPNGAYILFSPPWEEEHGALVRLENGTFELFSLQYYGPNTATHRLPMPA